MKGDSVFETEAAKEALASMSREELSSNAEWIALRVGAKAFALTGIISAPATYFAIRRSPWFRKSTGVSGRVASAFIPPLFAFTFMAEHTASRLARPDAYETFVAKPSVPVHRQFKQMVDENPAKFLALVGVPTVGGIFYVNSKQSHLTFSQKVMHTRVMGQAAVLAILSGVALYHMLESLHDEPHEKKPAHA
mmetsp:Transcript_20894/g.52909  ORF Transcript_20894/g.52909 Transcript_20894/m.52909 type:complete len:193 (-) Transcript_20894:107-685(-)